MDTKHSKALAAADYLNHSVNVESLKEPGVKMYTFLNNKQTKCSLTLVYFIKT